MALPSDVPRRKGEKGSQHVHNHRVVTRRSGTADTSPYLLGVSCVMCNVYTRSYEEIENIDEVNGPLSSTPVIKCL